MLRCISLKQLHTEGMVSISFENVHLIATELKFSLRVAKVNANKNIEFGKFPFLDCIDVQKWFVSFFNKMLMVKST